MHVRASQAARVFGSRIEDRFFPQDGDGHFGPPEPGIIAFFCDVSVSALKCYLSAGD